MIEEYTIQFDSNFNKYMLPIELVDLFNETLELVNKGDHDSELNFRETFEGYKVNDIEIRYPDTMSCL